MEETTIAPALDTLSLFQAEIDELVWELDITPMEAVILYCETKNVEIESVGALVKKLPVLKASIAEEAESLNFMKKSARLPGL